jgi:hypothetical protein
VSHNSGKFACKELFSGQHSIAAANIPPGWYYVHLVNHERMGGYYMGKNGELKHRTYSVTLELHKQDDTHTRQQLLLWRKVSVQPSSILWFPLRPK